MPQNPATASDDGLRSSADVRTGFIKRLTAPGWREVRYAVVDGQAMFEGDIVLGTVDEMEELSRSLRERPEAALPSRLEPRGIGLTGAQFRWPNGLVPFQIDTNLPDQSRVRDAIRHWEERAVIRFVERTPANAGQFPNFVTFRPGNGCSSSIGMRGGEQFINLGAGCTTGNTIHEIGHTVGLWHEQSREDRNQFVQVNFQNITPGFEHNFDQQITDGDDLGTYDYGSIMHYPATAFSQNGQPTIVALGGQPIGQRNGLSEGDIAAVHAMYATRDPAGYTWNVDNTQHVVYYAGAHIHELWFNGQWNHNDLTAAAGAPLAAGDPSGYTWDVDSTQHVVYRGRDGHVHELWFNGQWNHNDLTAAAGAPPTAGDLAGYTWDVDSTQHVVYRSNSQIHELWFNGQWNYNNLTQATGAPATVGEPAGYTWDVDSTQHVVYRGGDGHIHELWFNGQWNHNDLTAAVGAPAAAGDPDGYTWDVDSTQHVVYRGGDGHIHELWFNGQWNHNDLTAAAGAPAAAGDPDGYTWDVDSTQHVVYRGGDGHIHELWFNGQWNHNDLTAAVGAPAAAGDPDGYTWDVDSTQHVVYRGGDGHIHELWFNGQWNHNDLTVAAGAPPASGDVSGDQEAAVATLAAE